MWQSLIVLPMLIVFWLMIKLLVQNDLDDE